MFDFLYSQLKKITFPLLAPSNTREFLSRLVRATEPITNDTTRPSEIYGGDLLRSVNMLVTLAEFTSGIVKKGYISSEEEVHNLATVVSNLLDPGNAITWQNLEQVRALS